MKQVVFIDKENNVRHGGILLDNGDLICAECGGLFEASERGKTWDIVKEYYNWVSFEETIVDESDLTA